MGDEPWLDDEAAEEEFARVVEEAVAGREADEGGSVRLKGICAPSAGSGGTSGEQLDVPRRLPRALGGSAATDDMGARGGEYCVPASTVYFGKDVVDVDKARLWIDEGAGMVGDWDG